MKKYYLTTTLFFSLLFSNYLDVQFASFSYTIGGSYGSCVKFKKSEYSFSDFNECSCAWAANFDLLQATQIVMNYFIILKQK